MGKLWQKLRAERQTRGISVRSMAKTLGISSTYLSKVERGIADSVSKELLIKLANQYDLIPDLVLASLGRLPDDMIAFITKRPSMLSYIRERMEESTNA